MSSAPLQGFFEALIRNKLTAALSTCLWGTARLEILSGTRC
jgi:hypothetical protein